MRRAGPNFRSGCLRCPETSQSALGQIRTGDARFRKVSGCLFGSVVRTLKGGLTCGNVTRLLSTPYTVCRADVVPLWSRCMLQRRDVRGLTSPTVGNPAGNHAEHDGRQGREGSGREWHAPERLEGGGAATAGRTDGRAQRWEEDKEYDQAGNHRESARAYGHHHMMAREGPVSRSAFRAKAAPVPLIVAATRSAAGVSRVELVRSRSDANAPLTLRGLAEQLTIRGTGLPERNHGWARRVEPSGGVSTRNGGRMGESGMIRQLKTGVMASALCLTALGCADDVEVSGGGWPKSIAVTASPGAPAGASLGRVDVEPGAATARWVKAGETFAVTIWGSGSCPAVPVEVRADPAGGVVTLGVSDSYEGACTSDLGPYTSVVRMPEPFDVVCPVQLVVQNSGVPDIRIVL